MVKTVYRAYDGSEFEDLKSAQDYEDAKLPGNETYKFHGCSDDLIYITYPGEYEDEFYLDQKFVFINALTSDKVEIRVEYGDGGCWSFHPVLLDEDQSVPKMTYEYEKNGYSLDLTVTVPKGTYLQIS